MVQHIKSRSQRRLEKKQALVILALVLAVSLVSFTLGVLVGRGSAPELAQPQVQVPATRVPVTARTVQNQSPPAAEEPAQKLTFYDTLPRGEDLPLGSGINLPPRQEAATESAASAPKPPAAPPAPALSTEPAGAPPTSDAGAYMLQVASFKSSADARKLEDRLNGKGYRAFIQQADLGEKGVWHRVMVGKFATADDARQAAAQLKAQEKLAALIKQD